MAALTVCVYLRVWHRPSTDGSEPQLRTRSEVLISSCLAVSSITVDSLIVRVAQSPRTSAEIVPELRATPSITRRHEVACIKVETLSGAR